MAKKTADALKQFQDKSFLKESGIYDENTRLSLKLNLMEDRLKAAPVVEAEADHQLKPNIQVDQEPLPDLPLDSVLTLTAQIALGMYGDVMGIERIEVFDDADGKLLKIKRLAMCLWAEVKQMGDFEGGNQALLNIESAVYWATQQAASKHNQ
ncbi:hypothetical protein [Bartonella sp. HY761]|uniref:hypothetical protein n=1 Tax=Bartonella sp. HY761 TaxID=2979330 RepID=UPI0022058954|nr:hypothetical protein [Bartonella sp. HY761]UXN07531.1 hypothetical protein N6A79_05975 [Bartonella sp. HY761]